MPEQRATTLFEDAVDVPIWLEADGARALAERTRRDREIGRSLEARDDVARVRGWWQRVERVASDSGGTRLENARSWVALVLALLGVLAGIGLALAAYRYDGTHPVNVVRVLGLLLVPQLVLLAFNLALIPGRLPGLGFVQDALASINPGAIAAGIFRQLAGQDQARMFGWTSARSGAARRFGKWQMLFWSQIAGVSFNLGAIAAAITVITFTDLAFGWSTTLDVDSRFVASLVETLGTPWQTLVPAAVPDAELVERSRFFRLEGGRDFADSQALTGWWSFTLLAVVVYGLVPRLVFLAVAGWRLRAATRALLLSDPRVTALLDRLSAPKVESRGAGSEADAASAPTTPRAVTPRAPLSGTARAVIWNECLGRDAAAELVRARFDLEVEAVAEAGSGSLEADRAALERLAKHSGAVLVLTPAWEPPLLEFTDFVAAMRETVGAGVSIVIVPVGEAGSAISAQERETWSFAVQRAEDPAVYLETGEA